jgi:UDP-N-acetyl-alpha-D-muramoyl-L-alanyl-L-glutamate epimerase
MENQQLTTLRQKHPIFNYDSVEVLHQENQLTLKFYYSFGSEIHFQTELIFKQVSSEMYQQIDKRLLEQWAFQIGMVEALSYWKAACSPKFVINAGYLSDTQLMFWKNLLQKGLSEFFFVNHIDGWQEGFIEFEVNASVQEYSKDEKLHMNELIVPIGGGKDSIVSLELLAKVSPRLATLTIAPTHQVKNLLSEAQKIHPEFVENILIERRLDPQLLQLNKEGYLNGHTPFSAMAAFVSTFAAYVFDYAYVAVSNEFSANEGNTIFLGQNINHQYSKTVEFEGMFRNYCHSYLSTTIKYFSFVRPLHEIQIAQIFAQQEIYFPLFLSCNRGHKTGKWCGECAKCLFVYTMLSPFVDLKKLIQIWGKDLFAQESLRPILDELAGVIETKSFDCVGTREEMLCALYLSIQKREGGGGELPVLLQYAADKLVNDDQLWQKNAAEILTRFESQHYLPDKYVHILTDSLREIQK